MPALAGTSRRVYGLLSGPFELNCGFPCEIALPLTHGVGCWLSKQPISWHAASKSAAQYQNTKVFPPGSPHGKRPHSPGRTDVDEHTPNDTAPTTPESTASRSCCNQRMTSPKRCSRSPLLVAAACAHSLNFCLAWRPPTSSMMSGTFARSSCRWIPRGLAPCSRCAVVPILLCF